MRSAALWRGRHASPAAEAGVLQPNRRSARDRHYRRQTTSSDDLAGDVVVEQGSHVASRCHPISRIVSGQERLIKGLAGVTVGAPQKIITLGARHYPRGSTGTLSADSWRISRRAASCTARQIVPDHDHRTPETNRKPEPSSSHAFLGAWDMPRAPGGEQPSPRR